MLCSRPTSLKQRAPNDLLPRHRRKPSREAGSFYGQLEPLSCRAATPEKDIDGLLCRCRKRTSTATLVRRIYKADTMTISARHNYLRPASAIVGRVKMHSAMF